MILAPRYRKVEPCSVAELRAIERALGQRDPFKREAMLFAFQQGGLGRVKRPGVGGGGGGSTTTWSTTDRSTNGGAGVWTLSNGNLTATETSGQNEAIRATTGKSSGKWYWEVTPSANASFNCAVGIRRSDSSINAGLNTGKDLAMRSTGALFTGTTTGVTSGTGASFASGAVAMMAMDFTGTQVRLWIGVNGTWTNSGNPGAGTGALFVSTDLGGGLNWLPYFGVDNNAGNHVGILNVGPSFAYSVPSGFSAI